MILRNTLITAILLAAAAPLADGQTIDNREPTLRDRLFAGLKARRPSELQYIEAVLDTVGRGDLPERVVDRVLFWARSRSSRRDGTRRPIIYFQPAMDRVADRLNVDIRANPPGIAG